MNKLLELVTSRLKKNWRHFLSCRQFLILPEHAVVRTESPFLPALFHSDSKYFPHSLLLYFSLYPFSFSLILFFYSVLSAVTGSLFAAFLDGMIPPSRVSPILKRISTIAGSTGKNALILLLSATAWMIIFPGIRSSNDSPIPISPAHRPMITVSALNTCDTFLLDAPIARRIPISFFRSSTLM